MRTSIIVQNLKCDGCAKTIKSKLAEVNKVSEIKVDSETATVSFVARDAEKALAVKNTLKILGYPSIEDTNGMLSKAKSFVSCATGKLSK